MHSFKDLAVWSRSMDLAIRCYEITSTFPKREVHGLASQIRRSAVSIPSNIAEGAGRGTGPEFNRFLRIAYGSACETETQLLVAGDLGMADQDEIRAVISELDEIRRMLYGLGNSVKSRRPV